MAYMRNSDEDTRSVKGISFTNEYREEYEKLCNERNGSRLVCKLLREYYNKLDPSIYDMRKLGEDMESIKDVLERILEGLGNKA